MERTRKPLARLQSMKRRVGGPIAVVIASSMLATAPLPAVAQSERTTGQKIAQGMLSGFDIAVLRPLGAGRVMMGVLLIIPSSFINLVALPISRDTSVFASDFDRLLVESTEYTFKRSLGEDLAGS